MPGQTPGSSRPAQPPHGRLKTEPVINENFARARIRSGGPVYQEDSVHQRAALLARFEIIGGFALKDSFLAKIRALTAADLTRVARTWFAPDKKSVGVLLPKS
jgi:zinc protease